MKYIYRFATIPEGANFHEKINTAAESLSDCFLGIDPKTLGISDYSIRYLEDHRKNLRSCLERLSHILALAFSEYRGNLDGYRLLDYGGGTGILSALAKACGVGTVVYCDIYNTACEDAGRIGKALGDGPDLRIHGDAGRVAEVLGEDQARFDGIVSSDVIEHIQDLERFVGEILLLSRGKGSNIVLSTSANGFNPLLRRRLQRQQIDLEHRDREPSFGRKETDCLRAYRWERKEILRRAFGDLTDREVEALAKATRGWIEPEILRAAARYREAGEIPPELPHPTNTCDPYTGNWAERLFDPYSLRGLFEGEGFDFRVVSGNYGRSGNLFRRGIASSLNLLIRILGDRGVILAPSYLIHAAKRARCP